MKIQTLLNEYELDWVQAPLRKKDFPYQLFHNKTFVVLGNSAVTEALIYSLLNAIDSRIIQTELYWCPLVETEEYCIRREVLSCEKLHICRLEDISSVDYMIYTGICGQNICQDISVMEKVMKQAQDVFQTAASVNPGRFLFLSDYRAVHRRYTTLYISEYEHSMDSFDDIVALPRMTVQLMESLCVDYAKQYGFSFNILRTPVIFGACLRREDNFINRLASCIAAGEEEIGRASCRERV